MFTNVEMRHIRLCLLEKIERERQVLAKLDEDSDEYMERANDLMVLDSIISKIDSK